MATLLLETERTPATRITGYFENLSDSKFQKKIRKKRRYTFADRLYVITRKYYNDAIRENQCLLTCQLTLLIVFNRFNQAQSWLKKPVDQPNQPKTVFSQ